MKIHSHNVSITDSEMELIGDSLCETIAREVRLYAPRNTLDDTKMMVEMEMDLLYQLTNIGYKVWVDGGEGVFGHFECGTDVWYNKLYVDAVAKDKDSKVK